MIRHVVMLRLNNAPGDALAQVMQGLDDLKADLPGLTDFQHGPNIDAEGKSPDFPYGFICTFDDRAALDTYAADPRHRALGARLVALCAGGGDGIMVYDIDSGAA
ncbi:MAG: Dabb family protein [Loktanella sp.]|nr:Dabb family protein [Loktanella sp.]